MYTAAHAIEQPQQPLNDLQYQAAVHKAMIMYIKHALYIHIHTHALPSAATAAATATAANVDVSMTADAS
jgi:hypothetical protein